MDLSVLVDTLWVVVASGLVFFMQAGFSMVESGLTRSKNSINVAVKNLTDLGVSLLIFWGFGFALMFGASWRGFWGTSDFFVSFSGQDSLKAATFFLFQAMFCSTSATIVSGAVAERMRYSSYIISTLVLSGIIYPVFGHWAWEQDAGWLARLGFVDFAGSTVVHSVGGWVSLAILLIIGPRKGRFSGDGEKPIPGSSIPMAVGGVIILWFGWIGFNGGSTMGMTSQVPRIIIHTSLAAAAGMIASIFVGWFIYKIPNVNFALNGALAGLVAITAACHCVDEGVSIIIGAVGGLVMLGATALLEKLRIDDAVGAVPVHLAAGIWGTIAVGIWGDPEVLNTNPVGGSQILAQVIGVVICGLWAFFSALLIMGIINRIKSLRVPGDHEDVGLNIAEHGASTEIYDLYRVMDNQARTGDLSLRVPVEPFTEVGQIASHYNLVMENLEKNLIARREYLSILDNVSDGLFLLDKEFNISPYYAKITEDIFESSDLGNRNFPEMIKGLLPEKEFESIQEYLELLFSENINARTLHRLNPLKEKEFYLDNHQGQFKSKFLSFSFTRIMDGESIVRVMVILRNVTEKVEMQAAVEKEKIRSQNEMEMFYKILHIDPGMLKEFIESVEEDLEGINRTLEEQVFNLAERLDRIFRHAHSVKGNAALLELEFIVEKAHAFEDKVAELKQKEEIHGRDFLSLAVMLSGMYNTLNQVKRLVDKLVNFRKSFVEHNLPGAELIALSLKKMVEKISREKGKLIALKHDKFKPGEIPGTMKKKIKDLLIHLVRNSVAHGIETPDIRQQKGKQKEGAIEISSFSDGQTLSLCVKDDGIGIDYGKLKKELIARGQLSPEKKVGKKELFATLFQPGVSTAGETDLVAGRGIGMGLIQTIIRELRGQVVVKSRQGQFCEFRFSIPLG